MDDAPVTDFMIQHVKVKRTRGSGKDGVKPATEADYHLQRKAAPVLHPLPMTFKWVARLPRDVRPVNLLRQYPRVANTLAVVWRDRKAFRECLYDLLMDKRGGRQGFPKPVLNELLRLRQHFEEIDAVPAAGSFLPPHR